MAKKFIPNKKDRLRFNVNPELPTVRSFVPEIDCEVAMKQYADFLRSGEMNPGYMLIVMQHLFDVEVSHVTTCPFHEPGSLDRVERYYKSFMGEE
jgi:hypothetical protein